MIQRSSRFERVQADQKHRRWRELRIKLIVYGVGIWLFGPFLVWVGVVSYVDGRTFRAGHASTTATVVDRGSTPVSRVGSGFDRNMGVEFHVGGKRYTTQVLLPASVPLGTQVEIEYAVADPSVATLAGRRPPIYDDTSLLWPGGTVAIWVAAINVHAVQVRRYRSDAPIRST